MTKKQPQPAVKCAIYTRVSTSEQADKDYSSLESQRETGEAYIAAQKHAGWECLSDAYDDGGFTGANTDRPAFQRLLDDVKSGKVNCIVCYKLDRLTRSLVDFARTLEILEQHDVALVSVTQAFDTSTATGKLMMHILMSFAEFERQLISERTRDKIAATRRKGKWAGGMPVLGYDVVNSKLVVNSEEVDRVREIFELYLDRRSLSAVVRELDSRGWRTKEWKTKKGTVRGGNRFNKTSLYQLLTNPVYIGKVRHKDNVFEGEHHGIVDAKQFEKVQKRLSRNGSTGGKDVRNKHGALLKGLVRCQHCDSAMSHHYSSKGSKRYRYYVCCHAQKHGRQECPHPSIPAGELERFVVEQIRDVGRDPNVVRSTMANVRRQSETQLKRLRRERGTLRRKLATQEAELGRLATADIPTDVRVRRLAEVQDHNRDVQRRLATVELELTQLEAEQLTDAEIAAALAEFDRVWDALQPREQATAIELLVESVAWDAKDETVSITFRPTGIKTLATSDKEHAA
ncbi:MAG: recombinase family protein [Planctomycetaceae bacterium]|nr:recombinase family protein [Planctomycetales bacterium]MCB9924951.1 recombinase family protein [Planctomycetaceae bacterium]